MLFYKIIWVKYESFLVSVGYFGVGLYIKKTSFSSPEMVGLW